MVIDYAALRAIPHLTNQNTLGRLFLSGVIRFYILAFSPRSPNPNPVPMMGTYWTLLTVPSPDILARVPEDNS